MPEPDGLLPPPARPPALASWIGGETLPSGGKSSRDLVGTNCFVVACQGLRGEGCVCVSVCVCVFALLTNQCVGSPAKKISPELKRQVSPCSLPLTPFGMCPRDSYRRCHQGAGVCDGVTEGFVNGASLRVEAEPC